jgi:hypothetical protein
MIMESPAEHVSYVAAQATDVGAVFVPLQPPVKPNAVDAPAPSEPL